MDAFGLLMRGRFIIETLPDKPVWSSEDQGRIIYIQSIGKYFMGGISGWVDVAITEKIIQKKHIDWGFSDTQVSAKDILVKDDGKFYDDDNVESILQKIATGEALVDSFIKDRHLSSRMILRNHLKLGFESDALNAGSLLTESVFSDTTTNISVQTAINQLERFSSMVVRRTVQLMDWQYSPSTMDFRAVVPFNPIPNKPAVIQCFDQNGRLYNPDRVEVDVGSFRFFIWSKTKLVLSVVVVG